jgi:3',5'-cyclic AMP phosphodiesterase CpdA
MRTIVHLSDIHFGRFDAALATPLLTTIHDQAPDLVVISGDLTQRARPRQFEQARALLDRIERPLLVVPGNHDIPMLNIAERVLDPLRRYRRYVTTDLAPVFADDELMVVGINSARGLSARSGGGRVNMRQVDGAVALFASTSAAVTKIVVTHHPFDLPEGHSPHHLIGRAHPAMRKLAAAGADLFLAGHLHRSHVSGTAARYKIAGHCALVVQAGTLSTRLRRERNAFNVIRLARPEASIEQYTWDPDRRAFLKSSAAAYQHGGGGWLVAGIR